ncbi:MULTISPECIES: tetratricopeptide repeat protein [unclassified Minwuia]|uniref:tetratricopeptide repeat protein n=1 Tax=unclassified Minwuia TaxID=2618799 RepID=UPI002479A30F|nr:MULTISPECIES: tetratricopeptide repeat protein [unclassified Minwuia]
MNRRSGGGWLIVVAVAATLGAAAYGYSATTAGQADRGALPASASIAELASATERDPGNAALWKQLAQAHRRAGDRPAAISALVRAARLTPDDREINAALRDLSDRRP